MQIKKQENAECQKVDRKEAMRLLGRVNRKLSQWKVNLIAFSEFACIVAKLPLCTKLAEGLQKAPLRAGALLNVGVHVQSLPIDGSLVCCHNPIVRVTTVRIRVHLDF